jgi:hypothetical protein
MYSTGSDSSNSLMHSYLCHFPPMLPFSEFRRAKTINVDKKVGLGPFAFRNYSTDSAPPRRKLHGNYSI